MCHLGNLLVNLFHRTAVADDIRKVVALFEFLPQLRVFVHKTLPFRFDKTVDLYSLRYHRSHYPKEFNRPFVVPFFFESQVDAERSYRFAVEQDRDANERQLLLGKVFPFGGAVQKERFPADLRNDNMFAALDDPAGYAFAQVVTDFLAIVGQPVGSLNTQLAGVFLEQGYGAAGHAVMPLQYFQHLVEPGLQVQRSRKSLTYFDQRAQFPYFTGLLFHRNMFSTSFPGRRRSSLYYKYLAFMASDLHYF